MKPSRRNVLIAVALALTLPATTRGEADETKSVEDIVKDIHGWIRANEAALKVLFS